MVTQVGTGAHGRFRTPTVCDKCRLVAIVAWGGSSNGCDMMVRNSSVGVVQLLAVVEENASLHLVDRSASGGEHIGNLLLQSVSSGLFHCLLLL